MVVQGMSDSWYDRSRNVRFLVWSFKECQIQIRGMVVHGISDSWYDRSVGIQ